MVLVMCDMLNFCWIYIRVFINILEVLCSDKFLYKFFVKNINGRINSLE